MIYVWMYRNSIGDIVCDICVDVQEQYSSILTTVDA